MRRRIFDPYRYDRTEFRIQRLLFPERVDHPRKRDECIDGLRPCPYISCRYHLRYDVQGDKIYENPTVLETCVLDMADRDGLTLEEVGRIYGLTRERVRQIAARALHKIRSVPQTIEGLDDVISDRSNA